jgi:putative ABC transport system permease protein
MLLQEFRSAFHALCKARGYTLAAVLSLALGIGGNVAIFSLINAVLLRPLGYPDPGKLLLVSEDFPKYRNIWGLLPPRAGYVLLWRKQLHSFESIGAYGATTKTLTGAGKPERIGAVMTTAELFDVLGVRTALGRSFGRADEESGAAEVVILSDRLWRRNFGADPHILNRKIMLDGKPHEVIGIAPAGMALYNVYGNVPEQGAQLFLPLRVTPEELDLTNIWSNFWVTTIIRLKPGTTAQQARAEFEVSLAALSRINKQQTEIHAHLQPLQNAVVGDTRKGLLVLMGAVGFVLLIVCVNIANLALVRATKNRRDLAVRVALGASRRNLIKASLAESMVIGVASAALGLLSAAWAKDLVVRFSPAQVPRLAEATLDFGVVAFAVGLCVFSVILFGLLPVYAMSGLSPLESLQSASRSHTDGPRGSRLRAMLVSTEIAVSMPLLVGAGLLIASFERVMQVPRGARIENVISANLSLPDVQYQAAGRKIAFFRRVLEGVSSLQGVEHAGYATNLPLQSPVEVGAVIPEGNENRPFDTLPVTGFSHVSSDYFSTAGIPLRTGRLFRAGEEHLVAITTESSARRLFPGQNPIGRKVRAPHHPPNHWFTIVGVVGDVRSDGVQKEYYPPVYFPYWQMEFHDGGDKELFLLVRTTGDQKTISAAIREQVWKVDKNIPVNNIRSLTTMMRDSVAPRRFQVLMVTIFAAVALLLTCIGIYGVIAYTVAQRRIEIGLRLALGANRNNIKAMTLCQGLKPVAVGLVVGTVGAAAVARLIANLLFEVRPFDTTAFVASALLITVVAAIACWLPARQAANTDPIIALRYE